MVVALKVPQVGALNYLLQNPLDIEGETITLNKFDVVTGVSVGALNGAMIATRQLDRLNHLWFEEIANNGPGIIYTSRYLQDGKPDQKRIMNFQSLNVTIGMCKTVLRLYTAHEVQ